MRRVLLLLGWVSVLHVEFIRGATHYIPKEYRHCSNLITYVHPLTGHSVLNLLKLEQPEQSAAADSSSPAFPAPSYVHLATPVPRAAFVWPDPSTPTIAPPSREVNSVPAAVTMRMDQSW
jgi:hypothetical protein